MHIKNRIKKIPFVYQINALLKQKQQEQLASDELNYYCSESVRKGITVQNGDVLAELVKDRLLARGLSTVPKKKGDLHIFLAYPLNNWEYILPIALQPFCRVTEFEWTSLGFNHHAVNWLQERDLMNKVMLDAYLKANSREPVDVVVGYLTGYNCHQRILQKISCSGSIIINFCWDDKLHFRGNKVGDRWSGPAAIAKDIDLNLTNAPDSCIKYMVEGGLAMFWPEAAHPDIHKPYDLPFKYDVSFIGGKYGWRPNFIRKLQKMGINVTCFGNGWENGPLSDEEMVKLYSQSRINLGFAGVGHSKKLMCLKGRDFEVPMSGGLYLTQNNSELSLVYNIGEEIVTYQNEKDCAEKIKWLLAHPSEADFIRNAGHKRAQKEHTWEIRFQSVFQTLGILR